MKRWIMLSIVVAAAGGVLVFTIPTVKVYSADKEQRFPQLKMEQLNEQQRPFADEILKVSSIGITGHIIRCFAAPLWASACSIFSTTSGSTHRCRAN